MGTGQTAGFGTSTLASIFGLGGCCLGEIEHVTPERVLQLNAEQNYLTNVVLVVATCHSKQHTLNFA